MAKVHRLLQKVLSFFLKEAIEVELCRSFSILVKSYAKLQHKYLLKIYTYINNLGCTLNDIHNRSYFTFIIHYLV